MAILCTTGLVACSAADRSPVAPSPTPSLLSDVGRPWSTGAPEASSSKSASPSPKATPSAKAKVKKKSAGAGTGTDGWRQVYHEDFDGSTLPSGWLAYEGPVASTPGATWASSTIAVSDGALHLRAAYVDGTWLSAGVMNGVQAQRTYGKYEVRYRINKAPGVLYALLLWPKSERWPVDGEIDFAEDRGGNRSESTASLHWGTTDTIRRAVRKGDFTEWHTAGVEWSPGHLVYTMDGDRYGSFATSNAPRNPMNLALQIVANEQCAQWSSCVSQGAPAVSSLDIDRVTVYAPA